MSKTKGPPVKHVPMRTCIGTGVKKPKKEMIRLVRLADGGVVVDAGGKLRGRGANLDMTLAAFDAAISKKAVDRALKLDKPLTKLQIAQLRSDFEQALDTKHFRQGNKPITVRVRKEELE